MITTKSPYNWRNLQDEVATILEQCGFHVETEKTVKTSRGKVEIDVYAEEEIKGRKYSIVCECKHWKKKIPKSVIHSFRTVVADLGANIGYTISLKGFQSGAQEASNYTNIDLVTWQEFQNIYEQSWLDNYFSPTVARELDHLFSYTEPINSAVFKMADKLSPQEKKKFIKLREKYMNFAFFCMSFASYSRVFDNKPFPTLPIEKMTVGKKDLFKSIPKKILKIGSYKEFLEEALALGRAAIQEFRKLFKTKKI